MKFRNVLICLSLSGIVACGGNTEVKEKNTEESADSVEASEVESSEVNVMEKDGLKLYPVNSEKDFPAAALNITDPMGEILKAGPTTFDFVVTEYNLKEQTGGERSKTLANSDKGQHIHFIHNNAPYQAKYDPSFDAELMEGNNVVLAFLSKSYHESVKTEEAHFFKNFYVGDGENEFDENAQHLFYSRPKGEYSIFDAKKLLVDFYLINSDLSEAGNKVKLTVNDTEFLIPNWSAYFLEGLEVGEHTFRIQLLDKDGNLIEGPFNDSGERSVTIYGG